VAASIPPKARTGVIALALTAAACLAAVPTPALATSGAAARTHEARLRVGGDAWQFFRLTNEARARRGLPLLRLNREMSVLARHHSRAMANAGELYHTANVGTYLGGVQWHVWGENVGDTSGSLEGLQRAFMESTPHRDNILNRAFRHVAVGSVRDGTMLWVTVFFYG
jgi:uncharacterized protein YkwD